MSHTNATTSTGKMIQPSKTNPCATPVSSQTPEKILLLPSIPIPKNHLNSRTNNDDDDAPTLLLLLLLSQTFLPLPVIRASFTPKKIRWRRGWRRYVRMNICAESVLHLTLTHVILDWWERGPSIEEGDERFVWIKMCSSNNNTLKSLLTFEQELSSPLFTIFCLL